MILYHYTNSASYKSIVESGSFWPSMNTIVDAAHGQGWYFTDFAPNSCEVQIMSGCWGRIDVGSRLECYLKFGIPDYLLKKCRNHVYLVRYTTGKINFDILDHGYKPVCHLKPCKACHYFKQFEHNKNMKENIIAVIAVIGLVAVSAVILAALFKKMKG